MPHAPANLCLPASREELLALPTMLQHRASAMGLALKPPPPPPTTCCGRGCNGCVWEAYDQALVYWCEQAQVQLST